MDQNRASNELKRKLAVLDRIYGIYDSFIKPLDLACRQFCSTCCTGNMTLTTLEGYRIVSRATDGEKAALIESVRRVSDNERFKPRLTVNRIAELCRDGKPVADENIYPAWGPCPLLEDDACPFYLLRPFGCRCMVSRKNCRDTGYADIDVFVLTVNNLFLQVIEHVDRNGMTGNLVDILLYFDSPAKRNAYRNETGPQHGNDLVANQPIPVLMVPPEHRQRIQPILQQLQRLER